MANVAGKTFYRCSCYFTNNIFLKRLRVHINYHSREQFVKEYGQILNGLDDNSNDLEEVIREIQHEIDRRRSQEVMSIERSRQIRKSYVPIHPHLYSLKDTFFEDSFLKLINACNVPGANKETIKSFLHDENPDQKIYSFAIFTSKFCDELLEELANFENSGLPKGRPNTMNNNGILLSEMGFDEQFLNPLREKYLRPLTTILYPEWGGAQLDTHRAFVVIYEENGDLDLACHFDNAEVTLNVCLGIEFEGGELFCGNMWDAPPVLRESYTRYEHCRGYGLLHRARQRHGAMPLQSGSRYNFIMWMRSSNIRNQLCPMCGQAPDLVSAIDKGDGFTSTAPVEVCNTL